MAKLKMISPWINYYHELQAFFKYDRGVTVVIEDEEDTEIKVYVDGEKKAEALTQMLPETRKFGNVTLKITVIPSNNNEPRRGALGRKYAINSDMNPIQQLLYNAFAGNGALTFMDSFQLQTNELIYVVFINEVVQYYNDDLGDYYGQCSTLFQNLAADIFEELPGVHYCTDKPGNRRV